MNWLVAGCCGLVLINISGVLNDRVMITQRPRFYGFKSQGLHSHGAHFACSLSGNMQLETSEVQWTKVKKYNDPPEAGERLESGERITIMSNNRSSQLSVFKLQKEDSGIYFCKFNTMWGPGTELLVTRPLNRVQATYRSKVKDGLMVLQGLLLAGVIAALMLHKRKLLERNDSLYEEPETDHIYEGLTIETCGGGLYEELSVYAQPEGAEAPWE